MILLYVYISIFTIYFLLLSAISFKSVRKIRDKYTSKDSNLCIVLYATGNNDTLENLIKQLKNQAYPTRNYTIYVILDKCENLSEVTLQGEFNVNIITVNNLEPIGKSQAFSIIAEKLHDVEHLDAYVFLDSKYYVDSDFLSNVNFYLTKHDVFSPMVNYLPNGDSLTFTENIKSAFSRYQAKFFAQTRNKFGLIDMINSDCLIIKKDVLNKIAIFDFKDIVSDLKYTLSLAKEGIYPTRIFDINVYESILNFDFRIPSLSARFRLFFSNIMQNNNFKTKEFLFFQIVPNFLTFFVIYMLILKHAFLFPFIVNYSTILITSILLVVALTISLLNARLYSKEYLYLIFYPILSASRILYNFPPVREIRNLIKKITHKHVIEKMTTNVIVTDGKKDYTCQLELISDDGMARAIFINNGKKYATKDKYLRMVDAVKEINAKLEDYGMSMKACLCCKYFQPVSDGTTSMIKGCCNCNFQGRTPGDIIPTLIWNTCPSFEQNNIVNLF